MLLRIWAGSVNNPEWYDRLASVSDPWMPAMTAEAGTEPPDTGSAEPEAEGPDGKAEEDPEPATDESP